MRLLVMIFITMCATQLLSAGGGYATTSFGDVLRGATATSTSAPAATYVAQLQEHSIIQSLQITAGKAQLTLDINAIKGMQITVVSEHGVFPYSLASLVHDPRIVEIAQLKKEFWKAFLTRQVNQTVITGFAALKNMRDEENKEQASDDQLAYQTAQEFVNQQIINFNQAIQVIKVPWFRLSAHITLAALGSAGMVTAGYLSRVESPYYLPLFGASLPLAIYSCRQSQRISSECYEAMLEWVRLSLNRRKELPKWQQYQAILNGQNPPSKG